MSTVIKLSSPATHEYREIPVLFEDAYLLALAKPGGLWTSPGRDDPQRPSLMNLLRAGIAESKLWAKERGLIYLMNAHHLDYETSGVILLAKSKPVLIQLANLFGSEKPVKKYVALVQGAPEKERFEIDAKLAPHPVKTDVIRVDPKSGKRSRTLFEVRERFAGYTLLDCEPLTDRAHQIRVHLRHTGLPVVGDEWYGGRPLFLSRLKQNYRLKEGRMERPLMARAALHAEQLRLPHPVTGEPLTITAPWPKDLTVAVKYLRKFAASRG
jgi:RluA family pseudouridine synthase